jgi:hypothetical protein
MAAETTRPSYNGLMHAGAGKPIAFVSDGGGSRRAMRRRAAAPEPLRQVAIELDMVPIRRKVAVSHVWGAVDERGELRRPPAADAQAPLADIAWWAATLRDVRATASAA